MKLHLFCFALLTSFLIIGQEYNQFDSDGKRHGEWLKKYEGTDQIRYQGTFEHGKEVGEFKFYKPTSGDVPTAIKLFTKDKDSVSVTYFSSKGKVISEGKMIGKQRVGEWKYYHNNSDKLMMVENYKADQLHGVQKTYFDNGQLTEETYYVDGKREGKRLIYSEEGKLMKQYTYKNDLLHGPTMYYDTEGELIIQGSYKKNKKDGIWKYYKNGKLDKQKLFPQANGGSD
ncbi:toxin-antitoxin system YwqK family antitoxin [Aquimarina brevivitae]|uniref:Antitoxin component YwqK of YwqJK toxin-antitoxin module n=1 Tax=Aquimarina brevivitae TaxID=323412 RepID=A0A4Q7PJA7_9FLAO|nr:toxin-antitoxin system YwqK family antitoxin [Aquimarina brevivitae]RZT00358.1 antitoxin component YwqK of YwqJK toxin-antitoxin module [Aquimarina brevivitae]